MPSDPGTPKTKRSERREILRSNTQNHNSVASVIKIRGVLSLRRGNFQALCSILFLLLMLSLGCASNRPASLALTTTIASPTSTPIVLSLWHSETDSRQKELETLIQSFQRDNPDIHIAPVQIPSEEGLVNQAVAAMALGRYPDLVIATRPNIARFARQGGLSPLDDLESAPNFGWNEGDLADFLPGVLGEGMFPDLGRQTFSLPFNIDPLVLFYNADIMEEMSYTFPPSTWDKFAEMAGKATAGSNVGWEMQIRADVLDAILVSQNSALLDNSERLTLFDQPVGVATMTFISGLVKSGAATPEPDRTRALNAFASGHAAFYMDWLSEGSAISLARQRAGSKFNVGFARLPGGSDTKSTILIRGLEIAISNIPSARSKAAWSFVKWLAEPDQSTSWANATGSMPIRSSSFNGLLSDSTQTAGSHLFYGSFNGNIPQCVAYPTTKRIAGVEKLVEDAWSQIVLNKADISTTLESASARADSILAVDQ